MDAGRTGNTAALLWIAGAGLVGFAAGRAAVDPGGTAGAVLAGGLALAAASGLSGAGGGRRGGPSEGRGLTGGAWAALAAGVLLALGPRALPEGPSRAGAFEEASAAESPPEPDWTLPDDPELAMAMLQKRAELEALGASAPERARILEALLARERERRERAAAARREADEAAARADREREEAVDRLTDRIRLDTILVRAGQVAALGSGPLADGPRWDRALAQLEVLDPRHGRVEVLEDELERILDELIEALEAREEGAGGSLGAAIAALETRLRVVDRDR